ncbi:type II secretion system protein [Candidatus Magnetaquicoccus inordinatus]|uniref:type II secretion system protein n=1 Tax=Candidatus Magnetaquicoccus inordinatus TaxID=2496818 RepID=UPI00102C2A46|nr:type II secretion system protein [Candidatus Magnetaquicoccus inordinatus]
MNHNGMRQRVAGFSRSAQGGFSLIEIMVVLTIIAILAGIGVPKMISFIRTARASEAVKQMGYIADAVNAHTANYPTTTLFATYNKLLGTSSDSLQRALPTLNVIDNANFTYVLEYTDKDTYCIVASHKETGNYKVYYSNTVVKDKPGWTDHFNSVNYVSEGEQSPVDPGEGGCNGKVS